ncbi:MAG: nuclear transport factor 2 family protein [Anaerolineales bacterium]|nr:nuclear transport factor 2 family protein [Anaerolineales bacterium]
MYLWIISRVERGDPEAIAELAKNAGMSHVLIKIADGEYTYNVDRDTQFDRVPALVAALRQRGVQPWGWQYVYGRNALAEARMAVKRVRQFDLPGFVVNAEIEFKAPKMDVVAGRYMEELRAGLPTTPIALSTFRYPNMHRPFPYETFLEYSDFNMPQVYWVKSSNPAQQLLRTLREHQALRVWRPILPTGCAYPEGTWKPTPKQIIDFMDAAREYDMPGANYWEWYYARRDNSVLWDAVKNYPWKAPVVEHKPDIAIRYRDAINSNDPVKVAALYSPSGVHVNASHTRQGAEGILRWYNSLLREKLPEARLEITGQSHEGNIRTLTWTAQSSAGRVLDGKDSLGLQDDRIAYHYTYFTVQKS